MGLIIIKRAINEMFNYGIDIESHTVNHPKLNEMTYDEQLSELVDSKKTLESDNRKKNRVNCLSFWRF